MLNELAARLEERRHARAKGQRQRGDARLRHRRSRRRVVIACDVVRDQRCGGHGLDKGGGVAREAKERRLLGRERRRR